MRKFFSAILNEWRQHWRLLLTLFAAQALCLVWANGISGKWYYAWDGYRIVVYFILVILTCSMPAVFMAPSLLNSSSLFPAYEKPAIIYWAKFVAGIVPSMLFMLILFIFNAIFCYDLVPLIATVLGIGVGLSSLSFFISAMMPKTSKSIVLVIAILTTLLLFVLLVPGIMSGIALFGSSIFIQKIIHQMDGFSFKGFYEGTPGYIVGLAGLSFSVPCLIILPPLGYFLWTKKIMTGKRYLRSLYFAVSLFVIASITLCIISKIDGDDKLFKAKLNAKNIELLGSTGQRIPDSTPVPVERNAARLYYKAFQILEEMVRKNGNNLSFDDAYSILSMQYSRNYSKPSEGREKLTDFIQSQSGKQVHALLDQAALYPECRFIPQPSKGTINLFAVEMEYLAEFIRAQAYVYKFIGQEDKILPELEKSLRLAEVVNNELLWFSFVKNNNIIENTITDAIKIGLEKPQDATGYRRMLDSLTQRRINYLDNSLAIKYNHLSGMIVFQCSFDKDHWGYPGCSYFSKDMLWADLIIGYPLVRRFFADYINDSVKVRREMLEIRNMPTLPPSLSCLLEDYSSKTDYDRLFMRTLNMLFRPRSMREMLRIGLALKIYKCEHGKYPPSLQELVPAILPTIPIDPLDGKSFIYKVKNDNFILTSNLNWPRELSSEFKLNP